jgi:hypothetical protein
LLSKLASAVLPFRVQARIAGNSLVDRRQLYDEWLTYANYVCRLSAIDPSPGWPGLSVPG